MWNYFLYDSQMDLNKRIIQNADQCVQCGLCSQHCPTYLITHQESESARGRISLMKAIAEQKLPASNKLQEHLSHCLDCRACEAVCPAHVNYGQLIDDTRALLVEQKVNRYKLPKILQLITFHPFLLRFLQKFLFIYQRLGIQDMARRSRLLNLLGIAHWDQALPRLAWHTIKPGIYRALGDEIGQVGLFTGCIASITDQQTLADAIKVLNHCGYTVHVPNHQTCCGALHAHAGERIAASKLDAKNQASFKSLPITAIITCASGCSINMQDYPIPVYDISDFLTQITWPKHVQFKPLLKKVLLHQPCSLRNVLKQTDKPIEILQRIPQLQLNFLQNQNCCGAAGAYFLQHLEMANALVEKIISELKNQRFDFFVTSNIGCQLHIARAIKDAGLTIKILHPVSILASQLERGCKF